MLKKILVIADSHGNWKLLNTILQLEGEIKHIVFCGDGLPDLAYADIPANIVIHKVSGNVDRMRNITEKDELLIGLEGKMVLVLHGDKFGVKSGLQYLHQYAKNNYADIVLFGHSHEQIHVKNDLIIFNPGSLSNGEYGVIEINNTNWNFQHKVIC